MEISLDTSHNNIESLKEIFDEGGIVGRAAYVLKINLSRDKTDSNLAFFRGKNIDTENRRAYVIESLKKSRDKSLLENRKSFNEARNHLSWHYLNHAFTGNKTELVSDAKVLMLLSSVVLESSGQGKEYYPNSFDSQTTDKLEEFAQKASNVNNWPDLVSLSNSFYPSKLANRMVEIAKDWNNKHFEFNRNPLSSATDDILETEAVLKNPDTVIYAASKLKED
jgi:hypothetical protein